MERLCHEVRLDGFYGMVSNMKTTIEIPDPLLEAAKAFAMRTGTTLRDVCEAGLRRILADHEAQVTPFHLSDRSVEGLGLQPEFRAAEWESIRQAAYEDHRV